MYDPYDDDEGFMYWLTNTERVMLELAYLELLVDYKNLKNKYSEYVSKTGWEKQLDSKSVVEGGCDS